MCALPWRERALKRLGRPLRKVDKIEKEREFLKLLTDKKKFKCWGGAKKGRVGPRPERGERVPEYTAGWENETKERQKEREIRGNWVRERGKEKSRRERSLRGKWEIEEETGRPDGVETQKRVGKKKNPPRTGNPRKGSGILTNTEGGERTYSMRRGQRIMRKNAKKGLCPVKPKDRKERTTALWEIEDNVASATRGRRSLHLR